MKKNNSIKILYIYWCVDAFENRESTYEIIDLLNIYDKGYFKEYVKSVINSYLECEYYLGRIYKITYNKYGNEDVEKVKEFLSALKWWKEHFNDSEESEWASINGLIKYFQLWLDCKNKDDFLIEKNFDTIFDLMDIIIEEELNAKNNYFLRLPYSKFTEEKKAEFEKYIKEKKEYEKRKEKEKEKINECKENKWVYCDLSGKIYLLSVLLNYLENKERNTLEKPTRYFDVVDLYEKYPNGYDILINYEFDD